MSAPVPAGPPPALDPAACPFVSVVVPCRNEARFIGPCLDSILANDYPADRLEVIVADGMSDDGTRDVLAERAAHDPRVVVIDNARRVTPTALNAAIARARGEVIVRMDAHTGYPADYVSALVRWLLHSGADNVGGVWITCPADGSPRARAIAAALAHPFGVGNAHYRVGAPQPRWVDTVPFGCYRRETLVRLGGFDEELVRNQDDELNHRLLRAGGRILLVPDVASRYYARGSLGALWRTYWQYGFYKPLAARKVGAVLTPRQLAPAALVSWLAAAALAAPWGLAGRLALLVGLVAYGGGVLATATTLAARRGWRLWPWLVATLVVLHVSYGTGFLRGVATFWVARRGAPSPADVPLSR